MLCLPHLFLWPLKLRSPLPVYRLSTSHHRRAAAMACHDFPLASHPPHRSKCRKHLLTFGYSASTPAEIVLVIFTCSVMLLLLLKPISVRTHLLDTLPAVGTTPTPPLKKKRKANTDYSERWDFPIMKKTVLSQMMGNILL